MPSEISWPPPFQDDDWSEAAGLHIFGKMREAILMSAGNLDASTVEDAELSHLILDFRETHLRRKPLSIMHGIRIPHDPDYYVQPKPPDLTRIIMNDTRPTLRREVGRTMVWRHIARLRREQLGEELAWTAYTDWTPDRDNEVLVRMEPDDPILLTLLNKHAELRILYESIVRGELGEGEVES